ncbi:hypothetical protein GDO78_021626 [Eleutherodactylus coqui]|uniref:Taste receptor type 2 n=1 Tax=Eleutherodactylus coqui TaxID=57060 RepID=A0A8J6BH54_ELECQ|nr:hypothetical protein GDO78_021626 [Eleutherodactylus coqui]
MTTVWNNILHFTDVISLLIILPANMFILVMNILDWRKNTRLDISDQLISGLGLLSLSHRILQVSFRYTVLIHGFHVITKSAWLLIDITYLSQIFCTLLYSTWLAMHFCLKIVNINRNLYIYIQSRFPKMFPWILLLSVLASILISVPAALNMSDNYGNYTVLLNPSSSPLKSFISLILYLAFFSFFFSFFFILVLVTIVSLYKHINRMQNKTMNFRSEIVEAHVTAVKTLIALLGFNLLYFGSVILTVEDYGRLQSMYILLLIYTTCHVLSLIILIRGSSKLRKKLHAIWRSCAVGFSSN